MTSFTCLSLFNTFIQWTGTLFGFIHFGLAMIMTYFFIPFLYLLGIPWSQIFQVNIFFKYLPKYGYCSRITKIFFLKTYLQYSEAFAIKVLTFHQDNYIGGNPKSNMLLEALIQNNLNINVVSAILGLMVSIRHCDNNLVKIRSTYEIIKSTWVAILALFLSTAIVNSVEI